jgi:hypothetical protein
VRGVLRGTIRYWLPLTAGFAALIVSFFVGLVLTWLLVVASFGLILDGVTAWWEAAGGTGNLTTHRQ